MDNSKINQTELNYSSGVGDAKINLYTGRLLLENQLHSIGIRSYELTLSNIYNSQLSLPSKFNTHMSPNWKLNIEQYLYKDDDKYYYIDGAGMTIEFEYLSTNTFFDTSGLGLQLIEEDDLVIIKDPLDNKMEFVNERLVKTVSSENNNISKIYEYGNNNEIISMYDERKPDNKFTFEYNDEGLLCIVNVYLRNTLKYRYKYYYENGTLVSINKEQNGFDRVHMVYNYQNNLLRYAVYVENKSAFKFKYSDDKITCVNTGVATLKENKKMQNKYYLGDDIYVGEGIYCGDVIVNEKFQIEEGIETDGVDLLKSNIIEYYDNYCLVTNEVGLKFVYYFNEKGYTSSILEVNDSGSTMNDLRTLERMPGIRMLNEYAGNNDECINKQKSLLINTATKLSTDTEQGLYMNDRLSALSDYIEHTCTNYVNYVCSFWLKPLTKITSSRIKLKITSGNKNESFYTSFDNTAINSWQEVRIPFKINNVVLNTITLSFFDNDTSKEVKIADMKLYESGFNQLLIGDANNNCSIEDISKIEYYLEDSTEPKTKYLGSSTYITEKDLQMTYLYKYKLIMNNDTTGYFPLFYNDCTKFLKVKSVSFIGGDNNVYSLDFIGGYLEENRYFPNGKANYFLRSYSPDGELFTDQSTYFLSSYNIDEQTYNCMIQKTEAKIVGSTTGSYILNCTDFKGKTLLEQDEYGVQNIYKYNEYGDITSRVITSKNKLERIEETINYDNNVQTNENDITKSTTYYDDFDNIYKTELLGKNEAESNKLTNEYTYNYFNDSIQKVNNNLNSNNYIKYNATGRISSISPRKETDSNYYGYKFGYDAFGDIVKFLFSYKDKNINKLAENVLVTRNKERQVSETIVNTDLYVGEGETFRITNVIDKYGRNFVIQSGEKSVNFEYQDLDESQGAANITTMTDGFDNKTHYYNYNDKNELISYGYGSDEEDDTNYLKIEKISEDSTTLKFNNYNNFSSEYNLQFDIKKDEDKLISPRVIKDSSMFSDLSYSNNIEYGYDDIGRLNKKEMYVYDRWNTLIDSPYTSPIDSKILKEIKYVDGKNLIDNINTVSLFNNIYEDTEHYKINLVYGYNDRFDLTKNNFVYIDANEEKEEYNNEYEYNKASQLKKETFEYKDETNTSNNKTRVISYLYNDDGSIDSVTENGIIKQYYYNNGRLSKIRENNIEYNLTYDNLGNTLTFGSNTYTYVRGNLLNTFNNGNNTFKYYYNGQGKKYKKELPNGEVITYVYDNEKLISEKHANSGDELLYLYDMTGIYGFVLNRTGITNGMQGYCYYYEKDALGNVVAITNGYQRVAQYTYDAFGNCTVVNYKDPNSVNNIGDINPIRWKSMYCEIESNLYFINNNTYSPELRQTLSMYYLDEIINNSLSVNNLYAYNIYSTNPVTLTYDEYTSESALHLTYEPPQKSKWKKFWDSLWNRWWGKAIAIALTAIALVVTLAVSRCAFMSLVFALASVGVTLIVGGVVAGILSAQRGKGFWNAFADYINENWAQTLAIEMAMYLVSFGVTQALGIGTKCFIEGTLILTSIGLVKIEEIKEGDEVWSYNEETKEKELKKVKRLFRNKTKEWLHLTILNEETKKEEEIICTKNHRIYIKNKGWIEANEILENEEVLLYNNVIGKVIRKELENLTYEETTYNFEVEDNHNYYVGEECVLVHNTCSENDISDELFDPKENADEYVEYMYKNKSQKAFHQKSGQHKDLYISYDKSNHGHNGFSKFKLLKKVSGKKLELIGDLDQYGNLILNKNSSNVGKLYDIFGGKKL